MCATTTYADVLEIGYNELVNFSDSPRIDAQVLLQYTCDKSLAWLITNDKEMISESNYDHYKKLIDRRTKGQPIAYLIGYKDFWNLRLKVTPAVLIPRADTEVLVEQALVRLASNQNLSVLDLGTGSGAIALSIANDRPNIFVYAVDSQNDAISIAKQNASLLNIDNIEFSISHWFSNISQKFNMIVANPPYVAKNDSHLLKGDLRFEPSIALSSNNNGLSDLTTIIQQSTSFLHNQGYLLVEHGYDQQEDVTQLFKQSKYQNIETYLDINGLPRCTVGQVII